MWPESYLLTRARGRARVRNSPERAPPQVSSFGPPTEFNEYGPRAAKLLISPTVPYTIRNAAEQFLAAAAPAGFYGNAYSTFSKGVALMRAGVEGNGGAPLPSFAYDCALATQRIWLAHQVSLPAAVGHNRLSRAAERHASRWWLLYCCTHTLFQLCVATTQPRSESHQCTRLLAFGHRAHPACSHPPSWTLCYSAVHHRSSAISHRLLQLASSPTNATFPPASRSSHPTVTAPHPQHASSLSPRPIPLPCQSIINSHPGFALLRTADPSRC